MIGLPKTISDLAFSDKTFLKTTSLKDCFKQQADFYFQDKEFFSKKTEEWMHFPLQKILKKGFDFKPSLKVAKKSPKPKLNNSVFVLVHNGKIQNVKNTKDFFIGSLNTLLNHKTLLNPKIKKQINFVLQKKRNPFCNLNNLLTTEALVLIVNKPLNQPIEIHYTQDHKSEGQGLNLRNFIFLKPKAKAHVLEFFHARDNKKPLFLNCQSDCFIDKQAEFNHIRLDPLSQNDIFIHQQFVELAKQAKVSLLSLSLNAGLGRWSSCVKQAEQTKSHIKGLSLLEGHQLSDHSIKVLHKDQKGISHQFYKSFLFDSAKQIFNGSIIIEKKAQKTVANQLSKNFLFGKNSFALAQPKLDIVADNVKANHGAVISPFTANKELLFYLKTRGIEFSKAFDIILSALIKEILLDLPEGIKNLAQNLIQQKKEGLKNSIKNLVI